MQFALFLHDKPGMVGKRAEHLETHRAYLSAKNDKFYCAGPLLDDEGKSKGSLLVLDFKDRAEAEAWIAAEPFGKAGVYDSVRIMGYENKWPRGGRRATVNGKLFVSYNLNKPDAGPLRQSVRPAHLEYLAAQEKALYAAGPLLGDDGETRLGSLYIVDVADRKAAEAWVAAEPYAKSGAFARQWIESYDNRFPK